MRVDVLHRLRSHLAESSIVPEPGLLLMAVSGGPDSVAMLDLLCRLAPEFGLELALAHVDHGILPDSADVAELVMGLAVRYKVRGYLASLQLGPAASETRARRARYRALRSLQHTLGARYLATAHHADDQVETVIFRFLRGTGTAGLAGIAQSGQGGLIRPLLQFSKTELQEWLEGQCEQRGGGGGIPVHADPSNLDLRHDRSWVRQQLLPIVRERFGEVVDSHLLDVARYAAADREAWASALRQLSELNLRVDRETIEVDRRPLQEYDSDLSEALLRALAHEAGCALGPRQAARLRAFVQRAASGRIFQLGQNWVAEIAFGRLRIFRGPETSRPLSGTSVRWGRPDHGQLRWGSWRVRWQREPAGPVGRASLTTWVTEGTGELRAPQAGDRLVPLGGSGRRRVSRLLMEGKIPLSERGTFPMLVRGGDILWLPGICRAGTAVPAPGEAAIRLDASPGT